MKQSMTQLLACALMAGSLQAAENKAMVRFANDDVLAGSLQSLSTDQLVWESTLLHKPASFSLARVLDLSMPAEQPASNSKHEASVVLTNGDVLRGQLAGVGPDAVELDTWYAGRLKLNRLMISKIDISERQSTIYRGPTDMEGWTQSAAKPAWTYRNSSFRSQGAGSIARDVDLPDECSVAFDAQWRGQMSFKVVLFSDKAATDQPTSGYELNFAQRSIFLRSCKPPARYLGSSANASALQENEKAHIEIRASLKAGKVSVLIDGHVVENWTDADAPVADPEHAGVIHFIAQNASALQISRIEIGTWDGQTEPVIDPQRQAPWNGQDEEPEAPAPKKEQPKPDRMELRNGDNISGEVTAVSDGMIAIKTPFRDVKLPIESLRSVALKPADLETCILRNGDVRAWFPDGSWVVFRLDSVADGMITGSSQKFGTAQFKMSAFNRIEFNIYELEFQEIRAKNGW